MNGCAVDAFNLPACESQTRLPKEHERNARQLEMQHSSWALHQCAFTDEARARTVLQYARHLDGAAAPPRLDGEPKRVILERKRLFAGRQLLARATGSLRGGPLVVISLTSTVAGGD